MEDNNTKLLKSVVITLAFPIVILLILTLYIGFTKSKAKKASTHNLKNHQLKIKIDEKCKISNKIIKESYVLFEMANCKQNIVIPIDKPHNYYIITIQGKNK